MKDANHALTIQLLEWISNRPLTYAETLDAWHSTCPRLSIWEDACIAGLIDHDGIRDVVVPSAKGRALLQGHMASGDAAIGSAPERTGRNADRSSASTQP